MQKTQHLQLDNISNITAEKCLIASMLAEEDIIQKVKIILVPEDFSSSEHQKIVSCIYDLFDNKKHVTIPNIIERIGDNDGESSYLLGLTIDYPSSLGYEEHVDIVKDKSCVRKIVYNALELAQKASAPHVTAEVAMEMGKKLILDSQLLQIMQSEELFAEDDFEVYANKEKFPTKWKSLNDIYLPTEGNLCVIGADTNTGKTTLALNLAMEYALMNQRVLFFSCEMNRLDISLKAYSYLTLGMQKEIKRAFYSPDIDDPYIKNLKSNILHERESKKNIIDILKRNLRVRSGEVGIEDVKREIAAWNYPKLIFIDYIQEMRVSKGHSRYEEIAQLAHELKKIAMNDSHPCIVFAMSQLTRSKNDKGQTTNLVTREASDIQNKCDVFLELVDLEHKPGDKPEYKEKVKMGLNIHKHRMGPRGNIELLFFGDFQTFTEPHDSGWLENLLQERKRKFCIPK